MVEGETAALGTIVAEELASCSFDSFSIAEPSGMEYIDLAWPAGTAKRGNSRRGLVIRGATTWTSESHYEECLSN